MRLLEEKGCRFVPLLRALHPLEFMPSIEGGKNLPGNNAVTFTIVLEK